jgi:hypothetical protein
MAFRTATVSRATIDKVHGLIEEAENLLLEGQDPAEGEPVALLMLLTPRHPEADA